MSRNSNKSRTSMLKMLASENLPARRHSTSKYFNELRIRIYPDFLIANHKTVQFTRSGISFLLQCAVFLLLQTTLVQAVHGQGNKLDYNVDKRYGKSIWNSSEEITTVSWPRFMEQDSKETIEDWGQVLKMNKPRSLGTEAINLNNSQVEETTMSWMQSMEMDKGNGRESHKEDSSPRRLRRDSGDISVFEGSGSGMDSTTADVTTTVYQTATSESIVTTGGGSGTEEPTEKTTGPEPTTVQTTTTIPTILSTTVYETATSGSIETTEGGSGTEEYTEKTSSPDPTTFQITQGQDTATTTIMSTTSTIGSVCGSCNNTNQYYVESSSSTKKCECVPGYAFQKNACEPAKQFGGKLHMDVIFNSELKDSTSSIYKSAEVNYTDFLEKAYGAVDWFISVQIIGFSNGSTIVEYELSTKNRDYVNSATVQTAFGDFLKNKTYFSTCNCNATACTPKDLKVDFPVMAQESCADAGTANETLCKSPDIMSYCDSKTSSCVASSDGTVQCRCTSLSYTLNTATNRSCTAVRCNGCNEPYGTCLISNGVGQCDCWWGFQGTKCQQAWLFILVIVLGGLILIAIIVGVVIVCKRRHKANGWKTAQGRTYHNDALPAFDRYRNLSEWDEQTSDIVPTSYERRGDSEPYDDANLGNDNASGSDNGGHKEPNDKQPSLELWRDTEIGNGSGVQGKDANELEEIGENTGKESKDATVTTEQTRI